jgi:uroporphyrin-III C-methyltransferase
MVGKVYIVGAGPGDPKLLTLGALEALKEADLVIYDRLVGRGILEMIPASARRRYAGKRAGVDERGGASGAALQEKINALMLEGARAGKTVVRLKGGDPFVFARGGEELEFLMEHGIEVEVVPGVTSAFGVPAYAGIPPTHRGLSSSVTIVTGHQVGAGAGGRRRSGAGVDWSKIAGASETIIILMGAQKMAEIAKELLQAGLAGSTPMAAIRWGTIEKQKTLFVTVAEAAAGRWGRRVGPPSVIVIGKTVALGARLRWWGRGEVRTSPGFRALVGDGTRPTRSGGKAAASSRARI